MNDKRKRKPFALSDGVSATYVIESSQRAEVDALAEERGISASAMARKLLALGLIAMKGKK